MGKEEDLENIKEIAVEFEGKMSVKVRWQDKVRKKKFRKSVDSKVKSEY